MNKISLKLFVLFFAIIISLNAIAGDGDKKTYILTFPKYEMKDIKPLVARVNPLFEAQIEIKNDDYSMFYYTTTKDVTEAQVKNALKNTKYTLESFTITQ
jgi:hypothetical protein